MLRRAAAQHLDLADVGHRVEIAHVDRGCTGARATDAAALHGIALEVVGLPQAGRGSVLLPRRRVGREMVRATMAPGAFVDQRRPICHTLVW